MGKIIQSWRKVRWAHAGVLAVMCVILGPGPGIPSVFSPRSLRVSSRSLPKLPQILSVKGLGREYLFLIHPFRFLKHLNRLSPLQVLTVCPSQRFSEYLTETDVSLALKLLPCSCLFPYN